MTERDTHFAGAASLLYDEIVDAFHGLYYAIGEPEDGLGMTTDDYERAIKKIIAQRAYDLVAHAIESLDPLTHGTDSAYVAWLTKTVESIPDIPDLTKTKGLPSEC